MQDTTGNLGGSLVFSTSATGSTSSSSSTQLIDRLTISSTGLTTLSGSLSMPDAAASLTVAGNAELGTSSSQTLAINAATTFASTAPVTANAAVSISPGNPLRALGNVIIGTNSSNTLAVAAASTFTSAITANAPVTVSTGNALAAYGSVTLGTDNTNAITINSPTTFSTSATITANGNVVLGAGPTQTLSVRATSTFSAPITASAAVNIVNGNTLSALGNAVIGTTSANTLTVYATTTFNTGFQMYSNSATAGSGTVLGFQRQNNGGAVTNGFTLGSILFSAYDGAVQGPAAQIRSQFTVRPFCLTYSSTSLQPATTKLCLQEWSILVEAPAQSTLLSLHSCLSVCLAMFHLVSCVLTTLCLERQANVDSWLCADKDATGKWGGNLVFSTSTTGTSSTSTSTQLVDRLTIDSSGLATFSGSINLPSRSSSLTAYGSTVLGTTAAQTLTVNAAADFASAAAFTAITASGNVQLGTNSGQTLTVPATSTFSAPVTATSTLSISGLASFTGGAALTTPVTVNGVPLATVATTAQYSDLLNQPKFFSGSSTPSTAASGAPTVPATIGTWYGTVAVSGNSGVATAYPTSDGTSGGTALFSSILSVQATAYMTNTPSAINIPYAAVTAISTNRKSVSLVSVTGTGSTTVLASYNPSTAFAPAGTLLMCTVIGIW